VFNPLSAGLPQTLKALERRLNEALTGHLSRGVRRHKWEVAIDWHLVPYYGEPKQSRTLHLEQLRFKCMLEWIALALQPYSMMAQ
jgi:hypothetical protein